MGHFRFRRKVGPFNVSKTGTSLTTGVPGAHLNIPLLDWGRRTRRPMITLGMPGTGLSYRQQIGGSRQRRTVDEAVAEARIMAICAPVGFAVLCILYFLWKNGIL
jgi:hypothetical protein